MNVLLSLLPIAAGILGANTAQALPAVDEAVKACDAKQIKIVVCDGGETPDFKYDDEKKTDGEKSKPQPRPYPSHRPQPRDVSNIESDTKYNEMKKQLDENFKVMFDLKKELDAAQSRMSAKWEEYYALQQAYNKQLQKIVASWVTDTLY